MRSEERRRGAAEWAAATSRRLTRRSWRRTTYSRGRDATAGLGRRTREIKRRSFVDDDDGDHGGKEEGGWSRDSLNDTQIDDDERVRRYGILLTPGDAAQEDRWRIAANGYRRLTMVVVGCRTMTAWNTTTTPRGGWRAIGHRRLTTRTAERERRWGTTATVLCRGAPPLPPPNPPHPWHDDRGCCIKKCCSIHCK
jgi:hypothetical protein